MTTINSFLSIRDSICWGMSCSQAHMLWLRTKLYAWLEELFVIVFDSNNQFNVYLKNNYRPPPQCKYQMVSGHGISEGTSFVMTRKLLMSHRSVLIALNYQEHVHKMWIEDNVWHRYFQHCDRISHEMCLLSPKCYSSWFTQKRYVINKS